MAQVTHGIRSLFSLPAFYRSVRRLMGVPGLYDALIREYVRPRPGDRILDIGCGPGDVMLRLAAARPSARITAIDGSSAMLELARQAVHSAGQQQRVTLLQGYVPGLPLEERSFDAVLSKDLLHHLPDPMVLWSEARRLGRRGAAIYVMDLMRPESREAAHNVVETVARDELPILKADFYASLCAAFTLEEAKAQVKQSRLPLEVTQVSDRHMVIKGVLP